MGFEWILGGFGEVLGVPGGCQERSETGPKANSNKNLIFNRFWNVSGGVLTGFWEAFGTILEGFG